MTPSFTAMLGGFDFAPYLRVNPGEGLDPTQSEFLTPEFADSPYDDGAGLSSVGVGNKQFAWPLYINGGTKAGAIALEQQLNNIIANTSPLTLEWMDTGLSASTFWDVEFARFERVYNKRQDDQGWAGGILRVWARPYGHTGTERLIASVLATAPMSAVLVATVSPGSVIGDVPALTQIRVGVGGGGHVGEYGRLVAVAAVPAGYVPWVPAASMTIQANASLTGASGAPGSQAFSMYDGGQLAFPVAANSHVGRTRMFGIINGDVLGGVNVSALDQSASWVGATALAHAFNSYGPVDLGVTSVPTVNATSLYTVRVGLPSGAVKAGVLPSGVNARFAGVVLLPEDSTAVVVDPNYGDFMPGSCVYLLNLPDRANTNSPLAREVVDVSAQTLGEDVTIGPSCAAIVTLVSAITGGAMNIPTDVSIKVRERFSYARA